MKPSDMKRIAAIALDVRRSGSVFAATTYGTTLSGPDGGYAVPVDAAKAILMPETGALLPHCRQIPLTQGNSIGLPLDMSTPYGTDSGIVAAWESEGADLPQRRPELDMTQFVLKKLVALVPVTDELLEDSDAFAAWLPIAMQSAANRKVNDAIISGTGAGLPLGILNSDSRIVVAKAPGQAAGTILSDNLADMLARSLDPLGSVWIANTGAYGQLTELDGFDSASQTLRGLPIMLTDSCPAIGAEGDLILGNLGTGYLAVLKNPQLHSSAHLWFDQATSAFRLTFRMDGMPMLAEAITPPNSSVTKSHFVVLEARS
jgi:HK97 family phage major capsid protein